MKYLITACLICWATLANSQVYEEPQWIPPLPPPVGEYCGDVEKISQPVFSYGVSGLCSITDVKAIGDYQYGSEQVRREVMDLSSKRMVRRLIAGNSVFFNEIRIELHRASESTAALVCTVDMMGKKVIDAKIIRQLVVNENKVVPYEEPVIVDNNQLPNLGVFTYTNEVRYTINNCPV